MVNKKSMKGKKSGSSKMYSGNSNNGPLSTKGATKMFKHNSSNDSYLKSTSKAGGAKYRG